MKVQVNIAAGIIDQRVTALREELRQQARTELGIKDDTQLKSLAFVYLCARTLLDLDHDEAFDTLTEGGGDFGVDAIHLSDILDDEFTVTLFQAKYKQTLDGSAHFPEEGVGALINAIRYLFDPSMTLNPINDRLTAKVAEIRSLMRDHLPKVRAVACNNGQGWNQPGTEAINLAGFGEQVLWEHLNHERLVTIFQNIKAVDDTLRLTGKAIVEDFNYIRVVVGKMAVSEIAALIQRHGERLLERNIRRYLGLQGNRVNKGIQTTLQSDENSYFYFYNNGITLVCDNFSYNALQGSDYQIRAEPLVRYASCFIAMQMGKQLLKDLQIALPQLDHRRFDGARQLLGLNGEHFFDQAVQEIDQALRHLYGATPVPLQQLSASFRRGDLIDLLP